jgi:hypothetical protein
MRNATGADVQSRISAREQTCKNPYEVCIGVLFKDSGLEYDRYMLSDDASWEKILRGCSATGTFVASLEAMCNSAVATLATALFCDVVHITNFIHNYLNNRRQFGSMRDLHTDCWQCVSIARWQLDTRPFVDSAKRIEDPPARECACDRLFCQLHNLVGTFRDSMIDSMILELLGVKT